MNTTNMAIDVTDKVIFKPWFTDKHSIILLKRCICRNSWAGDWESPIITDDKDDPYSCPECLREFYFTGSPESSIRVFDTGLYD